MHLLHLDDGTLRDIAILQRVVGALLDGKFGFELLHVLLEILDLVVELFLFCVAGSEHGDLGADLRAKRGVVLCARWR